MPDSEVGKGSISIEQTNYIGCFNGTTHVTLLFEFWHHQIERGTLTIVDGFQNEKSADEISHKVDHMRHSSEAKCSDCPRHFRFVCRGKDLVKVAKAILATYEAYGNQFKSES